MWQCRFWSLNFFKAMGNYCYSEIFVTRSHTKPHCKCTINGSTNWHWHLDDLFVICYGMRANHIFSFAINLYCIPTACLWKFTAGECGPLHSSVFGGVYNYIAGTYVYVWYVQYSSNRIKASLNLPGLVCSHRNMYRYSRNQYSAVQYVSKRCKITKRFKQVQSSQSHLIM